MKAIVLSGGYAVRLHPYTENFPKALLKVGGRPILEYTLDKLREIVIDEAYIVTNSRFYPIFCSWQDKLGERRFEKLAIINDGTDSNESRLGSMGDLGYVITEKEIDDDILVICSDKIFSFNLQGFIRYFRERTEVVNVCLDVENPALLAGRHGCVVLGDDNRIVRFEEKPERPGSSVKSIAFYIYPRRVLPFILEYLNHGSNADAPGYFSEWLCRMVPMYAWLAQGECHDIGDRASYLAARQKYGPGSSPDPKRVTEAVTNREDWKERDEADEVRVLVWLVGCGFSESVRQGIDRLLKELAEWEQVTLVFLGVKDSLLTEYRQWLTCYPALLPVSLALLSHSVLQEQEQEQDPGTVGSEMVSKELAEELCCSLIIDFDGDAENFDPDSQDLTERLKSGEIVLCTYRTADIYGK